MNHVKHIYSASEKYVASYTRGVSPKWEMIPLADLDGKAIKDNYSSFYVYENSKTWKDQIKTAPFYPIDIDCDKDLAKAQYMAQSIVKDLNEKWEVDPKCLGMWVSGNGVHIEVPEILFGGFDASKDLHLNFKNIYHGLGYDSDPEMLKSIQLYRTPNSLNGKFDEDIHKVQIDLSELYEPVENLRELTKSPRDITDLDTDSFAPLKGLIGLNKPFSPEENKTALNTPSAPSNTPSDKRRIVVEKLEGTLEGLRNTDGFQLAGILRDVYGYTRAVTRKILHEDWNPRNRPPLSFKALESTINSAYNYHRDYSVNSVFKWYHQDEFLKSIKGKIRMVYQEMCLGTQYIENTFWKDGREWTVYPNQFLYTDERMSRQTGYPIKSCNRYKNQLKNNSEWNPIRAVTEYADGKASWTRITHNIYNIHHHNSRGRK